MRKQEIERQIEQTQIAINFFKSKWAQRWDINKVAIKDAEELLTKLNEELWTI